MNRERKGGAVYACAAIAGVGGLLLAGPALADEAKGKVVWVDARNGALLFECSEGGCAQIPSAKDGETYTFVIPTALRKSVASLQEGQQVTLQYEDKKQGGYVLVSVK